MSGGNEMVTSYRAAKGAYRGQENDGTGETYIGSGERPPGAAHGRDVTCLRRTSSRRELSPPGTRAVLARNHRVSTLKELSVTQDLTSVTWCD